MMMHSPSPTELPVGRRVTGKWTKQQWTVRACLGTGANGAVYSVRGADGRVAAMKVCRDAGNVAFEWGLLELMGAYGTAFPKPDSIDDSATDPALYFYVMEQISGEPLSACWTKLSWRDRLRVLVAIGRGLADLHRAKHAFCDVKPQNLLVDLQREQCVRFVDVGGVTPFGRAVRQFTPTSDCAYWGIGERRANAAYDMRAVALMLLCLDTPPTAGLGGWPVHKRKAWLVRTVRQQSNDAWGKLLADVLAGRIDSAEQWLSRVQQLPQDGPPPRRLTNHRATARNTTAQPGGQPAFAGASATSLTRQNAAAAQPKADWSERLMWASLLCASVSTFVAWAAYLGWL